MEEERLDMSAELERMKSEYAVLKNRLKDQEIINNRLILDSVRNKVNVIETHERIEYVMCIMAIVLSPLYHFAFGASWWFCGATVLFMAFAGYWTMLRHRNVRASNVADKDMLTFLKNVKYLRSEYADWLKIGVPLLVVWVGWLFYEIFSHADDMRVAVFFSSFVLSGLLIGASIGLNMRKRVIRTCDAIIAQLES